MTVGHLQPPPSLTRQPSGRYTPITIRYWGVSPLAGAQIENVDVDVDIDVVDLNCVQRQLSDFTANYAPRVENIFNDTMHWLTKYINYSINNSTWLVKHNRDKTSR